MGTAILAAPIVVLCSCLMMPPPQAGGSGSSSMQSSGTASMAEPGSAPSTPGAANAPAESKTPVPTTIEVHSDCPQTLRLFIGEKPKFGSGTKTFIGSNTTTTFPRHADGTQTVWIIDDSENASASVTADTRRLEIDRGCKNITAR